MAASPIAPDTQEAPERVRSTHPFHPLHGRELTLVDERRNGYGDRVWYQAADGAVHTVPRGWTSLASPDVLEVVAAGRARCRSDNARLKREREQSRRDRDQLTRDQARLERERDRLRREIERLTQALVAARRAGKRQAAPFSKGASGTAQGRPGRRRGRRHGRHGHRRPPTRIDETIDVPLPPACPDCGGELRQTRIATQTQEDLPVVRPHVRRFTVHVGCCRQCGRRVQDRHPLQTSDALGAASTHLGPHAVPLMVLLNKQLGLSHGKVAALLRDWFGVTVRPSGVTQALHRAARQAAPTYATLRDQIRGSPVVSPDETSWKVGGRLWWLWMFATAHTVVYAVQDGRGFNQAAAVLGADFDGVLVRDGWAPYRQFDQAAQQTCLAHLIRRCREIVETHPRVAWARHIQSVLQTHWPCVTASSPARSRPTAPPWLAGIS